MVWSCDSRVNQHVAMCADPLQIRDQAVIARPARFSDDDCNAGLVQGNLRSVPTERETVSGTVQMSNSYSSALQYALPIRSAYRRVSKPICVQSLARTHRIPAYTPDRRTRTTPPSRPPTAFYRRPRSVWRNRRWRQSRRRAKWRDCAPKRPRRRLKRLAFCAGAQTWCVA